MFKLKLFGTPQLEGPAGVVPPPGPRKLALLASLAASGPAGLTRDKVVARLWPEADDDRAKRNLSQLIYSMRSELGTDLVAGTGTLFLDPAQCWSDVGAFDLAIAERRDADALALYAGPFLDGFHLSDSAEFSEWEDGERDRRVATARTAAARVADALSASDTHAATAAWHRAVSLDPLNSRVVIRHLNALAADGDRTGAIRVADQYASRVRAELDAEPDASVMARAETLRRAPASEAVSRTAPSRSANAIPAPTAPAVTELDAAALRPRADEAEPDARPASWRTPRQAFILGGAAVLLVISVIAWATRAPAALGDDEFVLLAEFTNHTSDSLLSRTVGAAVAAALQQSAHVVPLPRSRVAASLRRMEQPDTTERLVFALALEVAQREGVRLVLAGDIIESGSARELISRIVEVRSGRVLAARTFRVASDDDLLAAIDRLVATMRRDLGEAAASVAKAIPLPDVTTRSLAALHFYAEGLDAARRDRDELAQELFARAVALDTTFASAHAQLGAYFNLNNDVPRATYHFDRALANVDRLPLDEALRIRIAAAYAGGDLAAAVTFGHQLVELRPRDAGAWARLAFYLFTSGRNSDARAAYAAADSLAPLSPTGIMNIGTSWSSDARATSDTAMFDSARVYYQRAIAMQPSLEYSAFYNQQYGGILIGAGRVDSARATFERMARREPLDRARGLRSKGFLDAMEGKWRSAAQEFAQAAEIAVGNRQWTSAIRNDALQGDLLLTIGDRARAVAPLRRATTIALREPIEARAVAFIALAQVKAGDRVTATRLLDRMRAVSRPEHAAEQAAILTVEGALHLAAGRAAEARAALETAILQDSTAPQTLLLLARAQAAAGDDAASEARWESAARRFDFGVEGQFDWQFAPYERARVLERMGRWEQAVADYRRIVAQYPVGTSDPEPPALKDSRERLKRLERGNR